IGVPQIEPFQRLGLEAPAGAGTSNGGKDNATVLSVTYDQLRLTGGMIPVRQIAKVMCGSGTLKLRASCQETSGPTPDPAYATAVVPPRWTYIANECVRLTGQK